MRKVFSNSWKKSKQKRKQIKYTANAPMNTKNKMLSVNLSKELRRKYSLRSLTLRTGDKVKILRGSFKGKTGKVSATSLHTSLVFIEKMDREKIDGTKSPIPFQPSNLQITEAVLEDKKRKKSIERKKSKEKQE